MQQLQRLPLVGLGILIAVAVGAVGVCVLLATGGFVVWNSPRLGLRPTPTVGAATGVATAAPLPPAVKSTPQVGQLSSSRTLAEIAADIPIPANVETGAFVGAPDNFSFLTDLSYEETLAFYQTELERLEWAKEDYGTKLGRTGAELRYAKAARRLTVRIAEMPFVGTLVEIQVQV